MEELVPLGMAIAGALAIAFFAAKGVRAWRLRGVGIRTTGVITARRTRSSMHYAHFQDPLGRPVEGVSDFGTMVPRLAPGDGVPVIYDPADPSYARINTLVHGGFLGAAMGIRVGVLFLGMGLLFMTA